MKISLPYRAMCLAFYFAHNLRQSDTVFVAWGMVKPSEIADGLKMQNAYCGCSGEVDDLADFADVYAGNEGWHQHYADSLCRARTQSGSRRRQVNIRQALSASSGR